jgi:hypothetical protein
LLSTFLVFLNPAGSAGGQQIEAQLAVPRATFGNYLARAATKFAALLQNSS